MISVIVCSVNPELAGQINSNIDKTVGIPWEAIIIDNRALNQGIAEVYNKGSKMASHSIVCFVHEDVEFLTNDWGQIILNHFESNTDLAMIGIAGASYKSRTLSGWMTGINDYDSFRITHVNQAGIVKKLSVPGQSGLQLQRTVTLDGVFLCARKDVIVSIPFDQERLKGFHLYDLDISFRVSKNWQVAVTPSIEILHHTSGGDFGNQWLEETIKWHKNYHQQLPAYTDQHSFRGNRKDEKRVRRFWLIRLRKENINFINRCRWVGISGAWKDPGLWYYILVFMLFSFYKKSPDLSR